MRIFLALVMFAGLAFQEAPPSIQSCTNDGKKGDKEHIHVCNCQMACSGDPNDHGFSDLAKFKCSTYCRRDACGCKQPCL